MNAISSNLARRSFVPVALSMLLFALVGAACGGSSSDDDDSGELVQPGDSCTADGQQAHARDGCNTCTCSAGSWACTKRACTTPDGGSSSCQPGATRPAGDTCNTCTCSESGSWLCTRSACTACTPGATTYDGCNECSCSNGQWVCTDRACPQPPVCKDGDVKQESCNSCTCMNGVWGCSKIACQCKDGETKHDGCNGCTCSGGQWRCTLIDCPPAGDAGPAKGCGGRLGNTCSSAEYCAYMEGQLCGAADASAVCRPRPGGCITILDPVCGCDGITYSNSCVAAGAGTGVLHAGTCK